MEKACCLPRATDARAFTKWLHSEGVMNKVTVQNLKNTRSGLAPCPEMSTSAQQGYARLPKLRKATKSCNDRQQLSSAQAAPLISGGLLSKALRYDSVSNPYRSRGCQQIKFIHACGLVFLRMLLQKLNKYCLTSTVPKALFEQTLS